MIRDDKTAEAQQRAWPWPHRLVQKITRGRWAAADEPVRRHRAEGYTATVQTRSLTCDCGWRLVGIETYGTTERPHGPQWETAARLAGEHRREHKHNLRVPAVNLEETG